MRKQFRLDIIALKSLYLAFKDAESLCEYDEYCQSAYIAFSDLLHALSAKYKTTPRQLSYAIYYSE